jgi:aminoglycoside 3-N-acetyltransferase
MNRHPASAASAIMAIHQELEALGVREGGVLLVHASLSSLGHVPGGPETVIRGLLEALGPDGTLLLPALSYDWVTPMYPSFDLRYTPSNVGMLPEYFRTREGSLRSLHPTHSVCATGPRARNLLGDHARDHTPVGPHSPFYKLKESGGQILMLGCGLRPNTSMHGVEELVEPPYLFGPEITYELVDETGRHIRKRYRIHGFHGWEQRYDRVGEVLRAPDLRQGKILEADCHLLEAGRLWEVAEEILREDELFFVDRKL